MKVTKNDLEDFRVEVCPNCNLCFVELTDEHCKACPRFFNWMMGYKNGIITLDNYEHPTERNRYQEHLLKN